MFEGIIYLVKSLLNKPFKIGIVSYYYPGKEGLNNGVAIHTYYLSRELAKMGCDVHVFCKGDRDSVKTEYFSMGKLTVHRINVKSHLSVNDNVLSKRISYFMFDNRVINEITQENKAESFDIIHTHGWLTSGAFISKYFNNLKWIHTFHALEKNRLKFMSEEEKKYFEIIRWMESTIKNADALITVSDNLKKEVLQAYPVSEKKIYSIPNGVDLKMYHPDGSPKDKTTLYVGRFSLEKGIDLVYKIAEKVLKKDKEMKFIVVASDSGIPKSLEGISDKFSELLKEYPDRFIWHRKTLSREELSDLYKKCAIYIQPSRYESFGMTVLEAMACGLATVVSNKGGMPELVQNAGRVIPLNTKRFLNEVIRLSEDYRLRERYSRRAIKRAENFSWEDISKRTLELYKIIAKRKEADETEK
ncbi:MAG: glycosyltransferase family 4 protein, partial [Nanoarchaeota archaeon]